MKLSVNLNKVALLRNSRGATNPSPLTAASACLSLGAAGITLHLREDERHTKPQDVEQIASLCRQRGAEFNLEGDPRPSLMAMAKRVRPHQLTLVPVRPGEITSDHGWELPEQEPIVAQAVSAAKKWGCRVSIFLDANAESAAHAAATGADRIEIYTEPYAAAFGTERQQRELDRVRDTARAAVACGMGVNAGHDLDCRNLPALARNVQEIAEVSIGHALVADALYLGLPEAIRRYLAATRGENVDVVQTGVSGAS